MVKEINKQEIEMTILIDNKKYKINFIAKDDNGKPFPEGFEFKIPYRLKVLGFTPYDFIGSLKEQSK